jgi:outer membrane protein OmpA-like peptidoglycan-associated protein
MPIIRTLAVVLALAIPLVATGASGQSTDAAGSSAAEIEQKFEKQLTRGLQITPSGNAAAGAAATEGTTVSTDYLEVPEDEQVYVSIKFDFDSAALRDDQKPRLAELCRAMHNVNVNVFRIVGHTDAVGSASYNDRLSQLRAEEVKRYMVDDCGIPADRLEAVGVGPRHPLNPDNPRGEENRRVEFQAMS